MAGKKQKMARVWKKLMKDVDLDEPTSFPDHVYLGCTQRVACNILSAPRTDTTKTKEIPITEYREMLEPRFFAGATEKLPGCAKTFAGSYDMEGHAQKCVERYCELANKKTEQFFRVSSPCLDEHQFKQKELESVGELSKVFSQIVLK